MQKQISVLTIALLMSASFSSAFAADLVVWEDANGKTRALETATQDFEKECNCKVTIQGFDSVQQLNEVKKLAKNGDALPDVFVMVNDRLGDATEKNLIAPINFMNADQGKYAEVVLNSFKKDGKIYAVPRSYESLIVYYNKDIIEYPFENIKDYENLSDKLKSEGKYGLIGKLDQFYFGYSFMAAHGGYVFGKDKDGNFNPNDVGLNNQGSVDGLNELSNYVRNYLPQDILFNDEGWAKSDAYFKEGKAAAIINGPWALGDYASSGVNYGLAPLPKLSNGKSLHPFFGAKGYVISQASKNKDLAERYLAFINKPKYALIRYMSIAELPPLKEILDNPLITNDDFANAIASQVESADIMPYIHKMAAVWGPMTDAFYSIIHEGNDAKATLNKAVETINDN